MRKLINLLGLSIFRYNAQLEIKRRDFLRHRKIFLQFKEFTMIPEMAYIDNLIIAEKLLSIPGNVVECGVWKGGMIAGISKIMGNERTYHLFDSFEGLPQATEIDGEAAKKWQAEKDSKDYFENCSTSPIFADETMKIAKVNQVQFHKGWFNQTLKKTNTGEIALLRLDGDWYESTKICLEILFPKVVDGGIIIIDDYFFWDGCVKAVHEYLVINNRSERIHSSENGVAFIIKNEKINRFISNA